VPRLLPLLAVALLAAACGSSARQAEAPPTPPGHVLYQGAQWAVAVEGGTATAYRLVDGTWQADRSGQPKLSILGPKPGSKQPATPQVAFEVTGKTDIADSAFWLDGVELLGKGGGLGPRQGTVYGAPSAPLARGTHTVVAYGRTNGHANAVAWTFRV
jgi:hypothetical protein